MDDSRPLAQDSANAAPVNRWIAALPRVFEALLVNAVPIWGLVFKGWSLATMLFLYWLENLLNTVFVGARIWLHRSLTNKRGHWMTVKAGSLKVPATLLENFAGSNLIFTLVHGVFVSLFTFGFLESRPSLSDLANGALWLVAGMTWAFALDARTIGRQPFAWIRARVDGAVGRMLLVHLCIIGGAIALAITSSGKSVFLVFVLLKLLLDIGFALPLSRPLVTDAQDVSAERRRHDEEVRPRAGRGGLPTR